MKSISILGVFVADLCFIGDRIPSKGQTILGKKHVVGPGGKGSNQAIAAARLNGEVSFITKVGKDSHSEMAFNLYKEAGVKTHSIIQDEKLFTGVAGIMIDKDGNNAINIVSGAAEHLVAEDIDNKIETIKNSEIFLTQMETPDEITIYALKKAKEHKCITILNPAPARKIDEDNFKLIDFFTPNETEAEFYLNKKIKTDEDIKNAANELLKKGIKNVIITLGEKGI
jgi:ribokinase